MPRSAIAAGLVDHVLAPERMPQAILQYLQHPYVRNRPQEESPEDRADSRNVQDILSLVLAQTGSEFRCYKPGTILRRIGRRMGLLHIADMTHYAAHLHQTPGEVRQLVKDLLINVTSFFRDPEAFTEVRDKVIAPLVASRPDNEPMRVWVPACATGEEAYSLAILLMEELAKAAKNCPLQVFATDLDEEALEVGRAGLYPENIAADVGEDRLLKFFVPKEEGYQVRESLRTALTFATQNVISDPPFSRMDLISCRNLLIYLDADAQAKLMALFNFALKPGGYLFLGRSESVAGQKDLFETVSNKARLCRRLASARPLLLDSPILPGRKRTAHPAHATGPAVASNFADVVRLEILRHFGASAVLVDRKGKILQFHGQTDRFLKLPAPGPDFNVFELARERLSSQLRLAIRKAVQDGKAVVLNSVPFLGESGPAFARVTTLPVAQKTHAEGLLVVFFEDASPPPAGGAEVIQSPENETIIKRLEEELNATRQDLQATIQELQSSNEELRAANEEVTSTNEELESTNEEAGQFQRGIAVDQRGVDGHRQSTPGEGRTAGQGAGLPPPQRAAVPRPGGILAQCRAADRAGWNDHAPEPPGRGYVRLRAGRTDRPGGRAGLCPSDSERHTPHFARRTPPIQSSARWAGRDLFAVRRDGTEFPAEIGLTPLEMPEGLVIMATVTDITVRKKERKSER